MYQKTIPNQQDRSRAPRRDGQFYTKYASRTHVKNVAPRPMRGGIRL